MVCVPDKPEGLKLFPVTCGPENVKIPPPGAADTRVVRSMSAELSHAGTAADGAVITAELVMVRLSVPCGAVQDPLE